VKNGNAQEWIQYGISLAIMSATAILRILSLGHLGDDMTNLRELLAVHDWALKK
jgi:hypothetical protein